MIRSRPPILIFIALAILSFLFFWFSKELFPVSPPLLDYVPALLGITFLFLAFKYVELTLHSFLQVEDGYLTYAYWTPFTVYFATKLEAGRGTRLLNPGDTLEYRTHPLLEMLDARVWYIPHADIKNHVAILAGKGKALEDAFKKNGIIVRQKKD